MQCASAYHHIDDIPATTRILASYLKPSGKLIVLDLIKDPAISDKYHDEPVTHEGGHGKHCDHSHAHSHEDGHGKHCDHSHAHSHEGGHGKHCDHSHEHSHEGGHGKHCDHSHEHSHEGGHGKHCGNSHESGGSNHFNHHGMHCIHSVAHRGGFDPKEIEKSFLDTQVLEDVESKVSFNFNKFNQKDQREYTFEYFIVVGKRKHY
jgi:hypothetical protein